MLGDGDVDGEGVPVAARAVLEAEEEEESRDAVLLAGEEERLAAVDSALEVGNDERSEVAVALGFGYVPGAPMTVIV